MGALCSLGDSAERDERGRSVSEYRSMKDSRNNRRHHAAAKGEIVNGWTEEEALRGKSNVSGADRYAGASCRTVGVSIDYDDVHEDGIVDIADSSLYEQSGALYKSARQRRNRLQNRNDGSIRNISREIDGARIDLVRQERKPTLLTDSVVEKLVAASMQHEDSENYSSHLSKEHKVKEGHGLENRVLRNSDERRGVKDVLQSAASEQDSCDTSIYASGDSQLGSFVDEAAPDKESFDSTKSPLIHDITLHPTRRQVKVLTDEEVSALLSRGS